MGPRTRLAPSRAGAERLTVTPELHQKTKELFLQACERPAVERSAFLDQACAGDPELRRRLALLLNHHERAEVASSDRRRASAPPGGPRVPVADASTAEEFPSGHRVGTRHRIVSLIGRGAMGSVYRADDLELGQQVALKFLSPDLAFIPGWQSRVQTEVRLAREVTHPSVCRTFDLHEVDGARFISMEYVDGEDLGSLIRRAGRLSGERAIQIAREICAGLAAAHRRGILHRDLKPANVMLDGRGRVRITDFGLAASVGQVHGIEIRSGTPRYMAPEQIGGEAVSERSDIYALGLILYEVFTGRPAFEAADAAEYARLHKQVVPPRPSSIVPEIDPRIDSLIMACLEKDPAARPQSAIAVAASLPGGDLSTAAIAAGVVPLPETIAAATEHLAAQRSGTAAWLWAFFAFLGLSLTLGGAAHPVSRAKVARSPAWLLDRAEQVATLAGFGPKPQSTLHGFIGESECRRLSARLFASDSTGTRELDLEPGLHFFYRASHGAGRLPLGLGLPFLAPLNRAFDVAETAPRQVTVLLAPSGRLIWLEAPFRADFDSEAPRRRSDLVGLTAMAGAGFAAVERPAAFATSRFDVNGAAFSGIRSTDLPDGGGRIESILQDGQLVCLARVRMNAVPSPPYDAAASERRRERVITWRNIAFLLMIGTSIPFAWRNWKAGGDHHGAITIGMIIVLARLAANVLLAPHVSGFASRIEVLALGALVALSEGLIMSIVYMAIELHVRRRWPQMLVGWSRVLTRRPRDPLVGREILVGAAFGGLWGVCMLLDQRVPSWLGWETRDLLQVFSELDYLLGLRFLIAESLTLFRGSVYAGLFLSLLLVLARAVTPRKWIAMSVAAATMMTLLVPGGAHPVGSWVFVGLGVIATATVAAIRYGVLAVVSGLFVAGLLSRLPLTLDRQTWYFGATLYAVAASSAVAVFGYLRARTLPARS